MDTKEQLEFLITKLLKKGFIDNEINIPDSIDEMKVLFRMLVNLRPPIPADSAFLRVQDEYLKKQISEHEIADVDKLTEVQDNIYLWKGDITTLKAGAIVNAANNKMLGCFVPCHGCIDNAIHTFAGVQLRLECNEIMDAQGHDEPVGNTKITKAYNLPSDYIIHTVGPIISTDLTKKDCTFLESCYTSCLELADSKSISSIAFCCISTGEYRFPNEKAAQIAIDTIKRYHNEINNEIKVIFNVFTEKDKKIYEQLLG